MTSKERLMTALNHREPDKIPHAIGSAGNNINVNLYKELLNHFGIKDENNKTLRKHFQTVSSCEMLLQKIHCDVRELSGVTKTEGTTREWEDRESFFSQDEWGAVYRMPKSSGYYYDLYKASRERTFENENDEPYEFPGPPAVLTGSVEKAKALKEAGYPVVITMQYGNGFLQTGPRVYGYEDWLMMLATDDRRSGYFMEKLLEMKIRVWDKIMEVYGDYVDILGEYDDLGTQLGPFIDPKMMRKKIKPYYKKLFDHIHNKYGAKVYFHSCGSVAKMIPDLIETGVDFLNPVQTSAEGMDPAWLKKEFGRDICFWGGGIDTQRILPRGTKQEIRDNVKRNIEIFGRDGGYVFCPIHNVQGDVPLENFLTMWETFMLERNY